MKTLLVVLLLMMTLCWAAGDGGIYQCMECHAHCAPDDANCHANCNANDVCQTGGQQ